MAEPRPDTGGTLYALAAALAFSGVGACVKLATPQADLSTVLFARNLVALCVLLPWILQARPRHMRSARMGMHLLRAGFGLAAMVCFFYALANLELGEAMLLNYSAPLFIPFVAWLWIGERPDARVLLIVALGFAGLLIMLRPGHAADALLGARLIALGSGLFAAFAMVAIRRMSDTEPALRIVFWFSLIASLASALPLFWNDRLPPTTSWLPMALAGALAAIGQLALTRAYALGRAARIGATAYSVVVFSALLGWWLWDEVPDAHDFLGGLLVMGACVMAGLRRRTAQ